MSQQLYLFPSSPDTEDSLELTNEQLLQETRRLFQHEGSTDELIKRIMDAVEAIEALCDKADDSAA